MDLRTGCRAALVVVLLTTIACRTSAKSPEAGPASQPGAAAEPADQEAVEPAAVEGAESREGVVTASGAAVDTRDGALVSPSELDALEGTVLLTFPVLPVDPACLRSLVLQLTVVDGGGMSLAVYPSVESRAHQFADGTPLGSTVLRHNRPRDDAQVPRAPGLVTWDVLDHYHADPSVGATAHSPEDHFALALRPERLPSSADVRFAGVNSEDAPLLRWQAAVHC